MANTGIIYRRFEKGYFNLTGNEPIPGEIVYATDTDEYGALVNGQIIWRSHVGIVKSVANKTGDVVLDKVDVGLSEVDNTSDENKPLSKFHKLWIKEHLEAVNPHNVTAAQVGLSEVNNTADIDKPISKLTQNALDLKLDKSAIPPDAKFTDTTYSIKDGELSEFNFNGEYKAKLDYLSTNKQLLSNGPAISVDGRTLKLHRADGSVDSIETQDSVYNDSNIVKRLQELNDRLDLMVIKDNLISETGVLSANQGKVLNEKITKILETLKSDNVDLDTLKEIVEYIEANRDKLDNLTIDNIPGLRDELNSKLNWQGNDKTAPNSNLFDNRPVDDFTLKSDFLEHVKTANKNFNSIDLSKYYTKDETNDNIQTYINNIDYSNINDKFNQIQNDYITRINNLNISNILTSINNINTDLTKKISDLETTVINKTNELNEKFKNIDLAKLDEQFKKLDKLLKDSNLETFSNRIQTIEGIVENLQNDKVSKTGLNEALDNFKNNDVITTIDQKLLNYATLEKLNEVLGNVYYTYNEVLDNQKYNNNMFINIVETYQNKTQELEAIIQLLISRIEVLESEGN